MRSPLGLAFLNKEAIGGIVCGPNKHVAVAHTVTVEVSSFGRRPHGTVEREPIENPVATFNIMPTIKVSDPMSYKPR